MATPTIESVITTFPHQTIPQIGGVPTYESINKLAALLKANAASVQTENGGGQLGHLAVCVSPAIYATLSNTPFTIPANPGAICPVLAGNPTAAQLAAHSRRHIESLRLYRLYHTVQGALRQQLLTAVPDIYLRTLKNRHTGYTNVAVLALLGHLYTTYGRMTPMDLNANDQRFKTAYDTNQPFETFVQQVEDAMDFADAAGQAYTATQIVNNAYNIMFNTNMFVDACRDWRRKPANDCTWANFKLDFALAHTDLSNMRNTSQTTGFHQANNAYAMETFANETAEAFANLATATTADRDMLRGLQATNQALLQQLTVKDAELTQLRQQVQQFQAGLSNRTSNNNRGGRNNRPTNTNPTTTPPAQANTPDPTRKRYPNTNYCWTHGYDVDGRHDSTSCRFQATGHQTSATRNNPMGGSEKNKDKTV